MTERDFRPWTSRVRSPSPALSFNSLEPSIFHIVSIYSNKRQVASKPLYIRMSCF